MVVRNATVIVTERMAAVCEVLLVGRKATFGLDGMLEVLSLCQGVTLGLTGMTE